MSVQKGRAWESGKESPQPALLLPESASQQSTGVSHSTAQTAQDSNGLRTAPAYDSHLTALCLVVLTAAFAGVLGYYFHSVGPRLVTMCCLIWLAAVLLMARDAVQS